MAPDQHPRDWGYVVFAVIGVACAVAWPIIGYLGWAR